MKKSVLHTKDIFPFIESELINTNEQFIVVSAFVKIEALKRIGKLTREGIEKILLVRFRKIDLVTKSTDVELFEYCIKNDWKMYFNLDLHSKIFVFDRTRFFIGSSNATLSGLGISDNSNIESGVTGIFNSSDYSNILNMFETSELMTPEIMNEFKKQLTNIPITNTFPDWNLDKFKLFKKDSLQKIWVCEFLSSASSFDVKSSDLKLLGLTRIESYDEDLLKEKFMNLKCYKWLINAFDVESYFGELTAKLHRSLIDDPAPYRKDVKNLLAILLNWINELKIEGIIIDRPNYSQRIRKIK